jgi:hypothetical protein
MEVPPSGSAVRSEQAPVDLDRDAHPPISVAGVRQLERVPTALDR